MGSRLSCSCPDAYCFGGDDRRLRIHAELFELSQDGSKWVMVEPRLLYITVHRSAGEQTARITATTAAGKMVAESTILPNSKIEKISDCFVFWRDADGRTLGVNTLTARDAASFLTVTAPVDAFSSSSAVGLFQQSTMCQVSQVAVFDGTKVVRKVSMAETTLVAVNPLSLVFHYNHNLINVDLLECFATTGTRETTLHLGYGSSIYEFEFTEPARAFLGQVLNMSSLLLARTTCADVAVSYLQRQRLKIQEKVNIIRTVEDRCEPLTKEKLLLKDIGIQHRQAALAGKSIPSFQDLACDLSKRTLELSHPDSPIASIYVAFTQLYHFRMWRKSVDVRLNDLKALATPIQNSVSSDVLLSCAPSGSSSTVIPIALPNGKTTMVTHENQNPEELLLKVCCKLGVQPELFELNQDEDGWRLRLRTEYEVEKKHGRLGLTIYAHNDGGTIRAEVRGVASFAPGGPAVGDCVVSVDGQDIAKVASASDVERLLRDGRVIRLRRRSIAKEFDNRKEKPRTREVIAPPPTQETKQRMEEKLHRALQELLHTERKYVEELKEMTDRYLCIRNVRDTMESALRLEKIQEVFLESLEEAIGDVIGEGVNHSQVRDAVIRVCALFVNRCSDFKVYAEYAAAYLRLQQELLVRKDIMSDLEAANCTGAQHCSYESRMIKPVQRVVQYPLLLRTIAAGCERGSLEARQVDTALQKMQTLAEYVNEMQRIHEQFSPHIDAVRKSNQEMLAAKGLRIDVRDLLIFAHIRWLNPEPKGSQEYVIFVFSSLVLLLPSNIRVNCKPKYFRLLPIIEVEVSEGRRDDGMLVLIHVADQTTRAADQTTHKDGTVYQISCCQPLLKQQLIKSVKKARTSFLKEHRRPLSGSSQSDGGYGSDPAKERKT